MRTGVSSTFSPIASIVSIAETSTGPRLISTCPSITRAGYSRPPALTVTVETPLRRASHAAAIRVPLPENSAREPSGFQIEISSPLRSRTPFDPMP